jgi:hypothetical protein
VSLNARLHDELLDDEIFYTLREATQWGRSEQRSSAADDHCGFVDKAATV